MDKHPKQEVEAPTDETKRQTSYLMYRWKWAEASIWTDKMLIALENGVKGNKYFADLGLFVMERNRRLELAYRPR